MFWLPLATTALGAYVGAEQGRKRAQREADIQQRTANMRAAEQQYAPWTGRQSFTPIQFASTGEGDAMLSGALAMGTTGASIGSAGQEFFKGLGEGSSVAANPQAGTGYLGTNTHLKGNQAFMPKSSWEQSLFELEQDKLAQSPSLLGGSSLRFAKR